MLCKFFTHDLPDGFSLEFECQQVSSSLQNASNYSGYFSSAVVCVCFSSSNSFSFFSRFFGTVPRALTMIGITVSFYYCNYYLPPSEFSPQLTPVVFYWSLSERKSPRINRTLLSILAEFSNAVVWIVSMLPLIFNTSKLEKLLIYILLVINFSYSLVAPFLFFRK